MRKLWKQFKLPPRTARPSRRAFTIMELMVAIAILVIIILSVGVIFNNASKSVSSSTALMETLSSVRGVQQQVEKLVSGMDRNSFLVIRSQALLPGSFQTYRFDQIGFIDVTSANNLGNGNVLLASVTLEAIPEPGSVALLGIALAGTAIESLRRTLRGRKSSK